MAIIAKGDSTYIVKLERFHVDLMQHWGKHTDPLFRSYNFPKLTFEERNAWYRNKTYPLSKKSYAVFNYEGELVGYIALRNMKWFRRTSELGIVFDPAKLGEGYGTDSLRSFIPYYFEKLKMNRLNLRVAIFNTRAQKCYINCGFKAVGEEYNEFEDQTLPVFQDPSLMSYRSYFRAEHRQLKCRFIHMCITKEMYLANRESYPQYPPNTCA